MAEETKTEPKQKTSSAKSTESAGKIRLIVKRMYKKAQQAKEENLKVAYCMVMCNYEEILEAMDVVQVYTENVWGKAISRVVTEKWSNEQAVDEAVTRIEQIFKNWK